MTTTSTDVATRQPAGPSQMIAQYSDEFALLLPSHIKPATFVRIAQGALRSSPALMKAAQSDPASLMSALMESARLGLEPGSDEYYLTPRGNKVLGIVGWKGEVEMIYRAGAVSSIIAEVVRSNDTFEYVPGVHDRPIHHVDWFGSRGDVLGSYAYAVMRDGAVSKVAVIGAEDIKRARDASGTASSSHSPWTTDYPAMVLKTAVHRLASWVPSSAEFRREQLRAVAEVSQEIHADHVDTVTGEIVEDE